MNKFDDRLLELIGQNARDSSDMLAEKLKVSSATVRRRLKKLIDSDMLRIIGVADPTKFGYPIWVFITMNVVHEKIQTAMDTLVKRKEVIWLAATTGRFDIVVTARFPSTVELNEFLRHVLGQIEGIRESETNVCLDIGKGRFIPFV